MGFMLFLLVPEKANKQNNIYQRKLYIAALATIKNNGNASRERTLRGLTR